MNSAARFGLVLVLLLLCGCGRLRTGASPEPQTAAPVSLRLSPGKMLIVPFSAGEGVEASKELDQLALMIVKGTGEELERAGSAFTLVGEEELEAAQFILEGHFVKKSESGRIRRWMPGGKTLDLGVQWEVKDRSSGGRLLVSTRELRSSRGKDGWRQLAYRLGQEIAKELRRSAQ